MPTSSSQIKVSFVLPSSGGGGGAHSVMQEAEALISLGVDAYVLCDHRNADALRGNYIDLPRISQKVLSYETLQDLREAVSAHEVTNLVATTNNTPHLLLDAFGPQINSRSINTYYYVQDYEPLFFEHGTTPWQVAYDSYSVCPSMTLFAKTDWICSAVRDNHGVHVARVQASIDHSIYYPNLRQTQERDHLTVAAMLRPSTPRRAPFRTARVLEAIAERYGNVVKVVSFGCSDAELVAHEMSLRETKNLGVLRRSEVGNLFRDCDLFLDLSDYQAFGRTGLEAMSCGAVPVLPVHGGCAEYAIHQVNAFLADTRFDSEIMSAVDRFVTASAAHRRQMSFAAIQKGFEYTPELAALSELKLFVQ